MTTNCNTTVFDTTVVDTTEALAVMTAPTASDAIRLLNEGPTGWLVPDGKKKESVKDFIVQIYNSKAPLCSGNRGVDTVTQLRIALAHASGYSKNRIAEFVTETSAKNNAAPLEGAMRWGTVAFINHDDDEVEEEDQKKEKAVVAVVVKESQTKSVNSFGEKENDSETKSVNGFGEKENDSETIFKMETWSPFDSSHFVPAKLRKVRIQPLPIALDSECDQEEIKNQIRLAEKDVESAAGLAAIGNIHGAVDFKLAAASKRALAGDFNAAIQLQLEASMDLHKAGDIDAVQELSLAIGAAIKTNQGLEEQAPFLHCLHDDKSETYGRSQNLNAIAPKLDPEKWTFTGAGTGVEQGAGTGAEQGAGTEFRRVEACAVFDRLCENLCKVAEVAPPSRDIVVDSLSNILEKLHLRNAAYHLRGQFILDNPGPDEEPIFDPLQTMS